MKKKRSDRPDKVYYKALLLRLKVGLNGQIELVIYSQKYWNLVEMFYHIQHHIVPTLN